jgi:23S rRNA (cytidine1920-2'-O)/16S rRNA (cytidine1409-2'-O)-methyltransferase
MRVDQLLVQQGLAPTRSAAQRLIARGAVRWQGPAGWALPRKAGEELPAGCVIEVTDDAELRWVSRGGLKLDAALAACGIDVAGRVCLDVGQGTGGFTDVLLARGATRVVGVEVGHGQLHARLQADPRVQTFEGVNARSLDAAQLGSAMPDTDPSGSGFDLVVGDLSFISLTLVLPALRGLLAPTGEMLLLVKPQFELQAADIGKGGLVKRPQALAQVEARLREAAHDNGLVVHRYVASAVTGGDGNREFFIHAGLKFQGLSP